MNSRRLLVVILCIIVILLIIVPIFVSGIGTTTHVQFTPIDQSPELLDSALASARWQQDSSKQYYLAAFETDLQSTVPVSLNLLAAEVTKQPVNARVHALTPDFAFNLGGFKHTAYSFPFVVETAPGVSPDQFATEFDFVVRSGRQRWARIPVSIPDSIELVIAPEH